MGAGQEYDENRIYGCLMVPVDVRPATCSSELSAPVEVRSWHRVLRWRLVIRPLLQHRKSAV